MKTWHFVAIAGGLVAAWYLFTPGNVPGTAGPSKAPPLTPRPVLFHGSPPIRAMGPTAEERAGRGHF